MCIVTPQVPKGMKMARTVGAGAGESTSSFTAAFFDRAFVEGAAGLRLGAAFSFWPEGLALTLPAVLAAAVSLHLERPSLIPLGTLLTRRQLGQPSFATCNGLKPT